jgi:UDP-glucose 4-epimerase
MNLLITGGAGYIGSHMTRLLAGRSDIHITVLDTLEYGHKEALPQSARLVVGSTGDKEKLKVLFEEGHFDAVMHFAAYLFVEESVKEPVKYFRNNLIGPQALLEVMEEYAVSKFIFSSTAAVYGYPVTVPIPEDHRKLPESPYGLSKLNFEQMLSIFDRRNIIRSISLRYFNACGASLDGKFGESHNPETHVIPLAIATALGKRKEFYLYGTDYETRDGTCERDFIHLEDLTRAHVVALEALMNGHKTDVYNVGTGNGVTNKEVVAEVKKQTGNDFTVIQSPRRIGDPSILVADPTKLIKEFSWKPEHSTIDEIIKNALMWHTTHPNGYADK